MSANSSPPPQSSDDEGVKTFEQTLEQVKQASVKKLAELDDDALKPKIEQARKRLKSRRQHSGFPRSGTDG